MSLILEKDLPAPRIELRWHSLRDEMDTLSKSDFEYKWSKKSCEYLLVLPLKEHDIRREDEEGNAIFNETSILMNETIVTGGGYPVVENKSIDTPYRDRAHAKWDAAILNNLPVYAVCDGQAYLIID